jgi:hypothetical protein
MCCGNSRMQVKTNNPAARTARQPSPPPAPARVSFEYAGHTAMTVVGPISGNRYRFDQPGARVEVDNRDRALLASIRKLRQVR